jgi:hypothetical protein
LKVKGNLIAINQETQEADMPGVFAGGDVCAGPGAIIDAIAAGRKAASSIDKFLGGDGIIDETFVQRPDFQPYTGKRERGFADLVRAKVPTLPLSERNNGFLEVDLCLNDDQAIKEASRCLQCDLELSFAKETGPTKGDG